MHLRPDRLRAHAALAADLAGALEALGRAPDGPGTDGGRIDPRGSGAELDDAAQQADALAARLQEPDDGSTLAAAIAAALQSTGGAQDRGPRLGDTSGARVDDDERGVQIPELPDPPRP